MSDLTGQRIGAFEILGLLGEGGMGRVYRARDTKLDRQVAIKILPDAVAADRDRLDRFEREAKTLAALNDPHIAHIHGFEDFGGVRALIMELVEGEDLSQRIARLRALGASARQAGMPLDEALPIARQIAEALEAAHDQGIAHRDLKPANIKITDAGIVKVLDFGLAKALDAPAQAGADDFSRSPTITSPAMTAMGMILGTAAYMSPEQARGKVVDKRTDIWAFGCVLYEMLTGQRAFAGDDVTVTLARVVEREPDLDALPPAVPASVRQVLRLCLKKDPKQRIGDIRDVRLALDGAFDTAVPQTSAAAPVARRRARRDLFWAAAVALLSMALVAVSPLIVTHVRETPSVVDAVRLSLDLPADVAPSQGVGPGVQLALSPDGRQLALVASVGGGRPMIWVRPLAGSSGQVVRGSEGAELPFWSPDSQSLGLFADDKLKKIDVGGGPPQTLCDAPSGRGATWNRDGVIVLAFGNPTRLFRVSSSGGAPTALTTLDPARQEAFHRWPQFLPDGRHFLFFTGGPAHARGIAVGSLDSAVISHVVNADARGGYAAPGYLLFVVEGSLVAQRFDPNRLELSGGAVPVAEGVAYSTGSGDAAFSIGPRGILSYSSSKAEEARLTWVGRSGEILNVVPDSSVSRESGVELSFDDARVAATRRSARSGFTNIWTLNLLRGSALPLVVDTGQSQSQNAVWSADGTRIVFSSNQTGVYNLYERPSNGGGQERTLLESGTSRFPSQWSPDDHYIVYHQLGANGGYECWVLPSVGDRKPMPYLQTPSNEVQGQLSKDGRWMAYASNESGRMQVYVSSFPSRAEKSVVSKSGGSDPRWRRDGRELFYVGEDRSLMAVTFDADPGVRLGAPKALFQGIMPSDAVTYASRYDVASDGRRFLVKVPAELGNASPIAVLLNWAAGLKH